MRAAAHRPWHDVPIYEGRDLASDSLWEISGRIARAKRNAARYPPVLPRFRRAGLSLVVAAVAAAAPSPSAAHARSGARTPTSASCTHRKVLELGDRGPAVAQLQRALGVAADGVFGPRTLSAVRTLQTQAALVVDGVVGPQTRAVLRTVRDTSVLGRGDRGTAVACLQRSLRIPVDGIFGPQTLRAVRAFQRGKGLRPDGIVGPMTRAALGGVDHRLLQALALADQMGLGLISSHRPGAVIESSGRRSDHAFFPSKAIDVAGPPRSMRRYARALAATGTVETVIHSPIGIWTSSRGWHEIVTQITYSTHFDHVHVDTF